MLFAGLVLSCAVASSDASDQIKSRPRDSVPGHRLRLVAQSGHSGKVMTASFSPDGTRVVTGSNDDTAKIWDSRSGLELVTLRRSNAWINAASFSPDGSRVVTGSNDPIAEIWDAKSGESVRVLKGHAGSVYAAAFSPDGKRIVTASTDKTAKIWDAASGRVLTTLLGHRLELLSACFSPDGTRVATGSEDGTARVWDSRTGKQLFVLVGHAEMIRSVAFSPNGTRVITASDDDTAKIWDSKSGVLLRTLTGHKRYLYRASYSPDGSRILTASFDGTAKIWDPNSGRVLMTLDAHTGSLYSASYSPDGSRIVAGVDNKAIVWDAKTGLEILRLTGHAVSAFFSRFSKDGSRIITAAEDRITTWDGRLGAAPTSVKNPLGLWFSMIAFSPSTSQIGGGPKIYDAKTMHVDVTLSGPGNIVAFSPDGSRVATILDSIGTFFPPTGSDTVKIWDVKAGKVLLSFKASTSVVFGACFSPDGSRIATASGNESASVWDANSGKLLLTLTGHTELLNCVAYSPDGSRIITGSNDNTARIWDAATGAPLATLRGHMGGVTSVTFSPDGTRVATASGDGTVNISDVRQGKELCSLMNFDDGSWAITDPFGRFDASNDGNVGGLHWVLDGDETIDIDQFRDRFYDPGLLSKCMGISQDPLRDVPDLSSVELSPAVSVKKSNDGKKVSVVVEPKTGGIGKAQIFLNGTLVETRTPPSVGGAWRFTIDLTQREYAGRLQPERDGRTNQLYVQAANAAQSLKSRALESTVVVSGPAMVKPPSLYAIVAGSRYLSTSRSLTYPVEDAKSMAGALRLVATPYFKGVDIRLLTDDVGSSTARSTKGNLVSALREVAEKAKAGDTVIVYLSGHGLSRAGGKSGYFYLTSEAGNADVSKDPLANTYTLSSGEIEELLERCLSNRKVIILDTCSAANAVIDLARSEDVAGVSKRAWADIKEYAGTYVLAGCAADAESYEVTNVGHGLLTYSLLEAIDQGKDTALRGGQFLDVSPWFHYAEHRVPELANELGLGAIQKPENKPAALSRTFDLGIVDSRVIGRLGLELPRPIVMLDTFRDADNEDPLEITAAVRLALSGPVSRGSKLAYLPEARPHPQFIQIKGSYSYDPKSKEAKVKVRIQQFVAPDNKPITVQEFLVEGSSDGLAAKILSQATPLIEALWVKARSEH